MPRFKDHRKKITEKISLRFYFNHIIYKVIHKDWWLQNIELCHPFQTHVKQMAIL